MARVKLTKSALWGDAELLCVLAADWLSGLEFSLQGLAGRCHRNAVAAKQRRDGVTGAPAPFRPRDEGLTWP